MMKNKIKIILILIVIYFGMTSCDRWLDIEPSDRQTEVSLFKTKSGFYQAINGVYNNIASNSLYGKNLSYEFLEIMTQRYKINASNNELYREMAKQNYSYEELSDVIDDIWKTAYFTILNVNKILYNIDKNKGLLTVNEAKILKGEMLAVRAFIHFDIFRLFAPNYIEESEVPSIPYNKNYNIKTEVRLLPKDLFNNYILKDISDAEKFLDKDVVRKYGPNLINIGNDKEVENTEHYRQLRFNYFALQALKARVYLWMNDKDNAKSVASKLLDDAGKLFTPVNPSLLLGNNTNPDRIFSTEVLFGIYDKNRALIYDNNYDNEKSKYYLLQPKDNYIDNNLFKDMIGDYRFASQWGKTASSSNQGYTLIKYKKLNVDANKEPFYATFIPLIRLSEMYLIIAECEQSQDKINELRAIRGAISLKMYSKKELIKEYLREFYGEGQSFFIFKRMKQNINTDFNANGRNYYFYSKSILPLPESEILPR